MNENLWASDSDEGRAARKSLAALKRINNAFAQYINQHRHALEGDPYSGMTVARQLSLAEDLGRVAEALMGDCAARAAAVRKYGQLVLALLEKEGCVPCSTMVARWGESQDLTFTLAELLREELIDYAQHDAGVAYLILPKGTLMLARQTAVAAPSDRPAVSGGDDV